MNEQQTGLKAQELPRLQKSDQHPPAFLTLETLRNENRRYAATLGVSQNNASLGFRPAYLNRQSGEWVLSRFSDGTPAPVHVLDGLPDAWVRERDPLGHVTALAASVVAGFVREGRFYTREEAARLARH